MRHGVSPNADQGGTKSYKNPLGMVAYWVFASLCGDLAASKIPALPLPVAG